MRSIDRLVLPALAGLLGACSGQGAPDPLAAGEPAPLPDTGVRDLPVLIGEPYTVGGTTYTPRDVTAYDEVGYAGVIRDGAGRATANGERADPAAITAAHRTLPLPTYVEVTALATGRTILVRVNDRGPMAADRLIDLSEGAARQLGLGSVVAGVRVRKTSPVESERAVLRNGGSVAARIDTPPSLLRVLRDKLAAQPKDAPVAAASAMPRGDALKVENAEGDSRPAPASPRAAKAVARPLDRMPPPLGARADDRFIVERTGEGKAAAAPATAADPSPAAPMAAQSGWLVQIASFASRGRAESLARSLGGQVGPSPDGRLFRVLMGPYASEAAARGELASMRRRGYSGAMLVRP